MKVNELLQEFEEVDPVKKKYLIMHQNNWTLTDLVMNDNTEVDPTFFRKSCKKLKKNIPVQYLCQSAYFFNEKFYINKNVLIPRPETEILVAEALKRIKTISKKKIKILEIGTGSGIIALTLKRLLPESEIVAVDISRKALKVAKINQTIQKSNIVLKKSNLFKNINGKYDLIISNPPYVKKNSIHIETQVKKYEPKKALFAKEEGYYYYRKILEQAKEYLNPNGWIAFEIGEEQGETIRRIAQKNFNKKSYQTIEIIKDLNKLDRCFFLKYKK